MTKHTSEMNNSNNFKQPEALRLADRLDREWAGDALTYDTALEAAAELRRLYAEVDRLSYRWAYPDNFERQPLPAHEIVTMYKERLRFRLPLTYEQRLDVLTEFEKHRMKWDDVAILIDLVETAHGIYEDENMDKPCECTF